MTYLDKPVQAMATDIKTRFCTFVFIVRNTGIQGSMTKAQYKAAIRQMQENGRALTVAFGLKLARWGMGKEWKNED